MLHLWITISLSESQSMFILFRASMVTTILLRKVRFIQLRSYSQYYIENYYTLTLRLIEIIVLWLNINVECAPRRSKCCSETSHQHPCMYFCQKCCAKCLFVPPGMFGNKELVSCYNNWKTKQGGPKCPWFSIHYSSLLYLPRGQVYNDAFFG